MTSVPQNFVLRKKGTTKCLTQDSKGVALQDCKGSVKTNPNYTVFDNSTPFGASATPLTLIGKNAGGYNRNKNNYTGTAGYDIWVNGNDNIRNYLSSSGDGELVITPTSNPADTFTLDANGNLVSTTGFGKTNNALTKPLNHITDAPELADLVATFGDKSQCVTDYKESAWKGLFNTFSNAHTYIKNTLKNVVGADGKIAANQDIYKYKDDKYVAPLYDIDVARPAYKYFNTPITSAYSGIKPIPATEGNKTHKYYHKCPGDPYCYKTCYGRPDSECAANYSVDMYDPDIGDFSRYIDGKSILENDCVTLQGPSGSTNGIPNYTFYINQNCYPGSTKTPLSTVQATATTAKLNFAKQILGLTDIVLGGFVQFLNNCIAIYTLYNRYYADPGMAMGNYMYINNMSMRNFYYNNGQFNQIFGDYVNAAYAPLINNLNTPINQLSAKYNAFKTKLDAAKVNPNITVKDALSLFYESRKLFLEPNSYASLPESFLPNYTDFVYKPNTGGQMWVYHGDSNGNVVYDAPIDQNLQKILTINLNISSATTNLAQIAQFAYNTSTPATDASINAMFSTPSPGWFDNTRLVTMYGSTTPKNLLSTVLPSINTEIRNKFNAAALILSIDPK